MDRDYLLDKDEGMSEDNRKISHSLNHSMDSLIGVSDRLKSTIERLSNLLDMHEKGAWSRKDGQDSHSPMEEKIENHFNFILNKTQKKLMGIKNNEANTL